eukprot:gene19920-23874_t
MTGVQRLSRGQNKVYEYSLGYIHANDFTNLTLLIKTATDTVSYELGPMECYIPLPFENGLVLSTNSTIKQQTQGTAAMTVMFPTLPRGPAIALKIDCSCIEVDQQPSPFFWKTYLTTTFRPYWGSCENGAINFSRASVILTLPNHLSVPVKVDSSIPTIYSLPIDTLFSSSIVYPTLYSEETYYDQINKGTPFVAMYNLDNTGDSFKSACIINDDALSLTANLYPVLGNKQAGVYFHFGVIPFTRPTETLVLFKMNAGSLSRLSNTSLTKTASADFITINSVRSGPGLTDLSFQHDLNWPTPHPYAVNYFGQTETTLLPLPYGMTKGTAKSFVHNSFYYFSPHTTVSKSMNILYIKQMAQPIIQVSPTVNDNTPPILLSFDIRVLGGYSYVIKAHITDDLAGLYSIRLGSRYFYTDTMISGNLTNGIYEFIYESDTIHSAQDILVVHLVDLALNNKAPKLTIHTRVSNNSVFIGSWNESLSMFTIPFTLQKNLFEGLLEYSIGAVEPITTMHLVYKFGTAAQVNIISQNADLLGPLIKEIIPGSNASMVWWTIFVEDSPNGFASGYCNITSDLDLNPYYFSLEGARIGGDQLLGTYFIYRNLGSNTVSQNYTFSAFLQDTGGNVATKTNVVGGSPNIDPFLKIYAANPTTIFNPVTLPVGPVDTEGPYISEFKLLNQSVDVGSFNRDIHVSFTVGDEISGVMYENAPFLYISSQLSRMISSQCVATVPGHSSTKFYCIVRLPYGFGSLDTLYLSVYGLYDRALNVNGYTTYDIEYNFNQSTIQRTNSLASLDPQFSILTDTSSDDDISQACRSSSKKKSLSTAKLAGLLNPVSSWIKEPIIYGTGDWANECSFEFQLAIRSSSALTEVKFGTVVLTGTQLSQVSESYVYQYTISYVLQSSNDEKPRDVVLTISNGVDQLTTPDIGPMDLISKEQWLDLHKHVALVLLFSRFLHYLRNPIYLGHLASKPMSHHLRVCKPSWQEACLATDYSVIPLTINFPNAFGGQVTADISIPSIYGRANSIFIPGVGVSSYPQVYSDDSYYDIVNGGSLYTAWFTIRNKTDTFISVAMSPDDYLSPNIYPVKGNKTDGVFMYFGLLPSSQPSINMSYFHMDNGVLATLWPRQTYYRKPFDPIDIGFGTDPSVGIYGYSCFSFTYAPSSPRLVGLNYNKQTDNILLEAPFGMTTGTGKSFKHKFSSYFSPFANPTKKLYLLYIYTGVYDLITTPPQLNDNEPPFLLSFEAEPLGGYSYIIKLKVTDNLSGLFSIQIGNYKRYTDTLYSGTIQSGSYEFIYEGALLHSPISQFNIILTDIALNVATYQSGDYIPETLNMIGPFYHLMDWQPSDLTTFEFTQIICDVSNQPVDNMLKFNVSEKVVMDWNRHRRLRPRFTLRTRISNNTVFEGSWNESLSMFTIPFTLPMKLFEGVLEYSLDALAPITNVHMYGRNNSQIEIVSLRADLLGPIIEKVQPFSNSTTVSWLITINDEPNGFKSGYCNITSDYDNNPYRVEIDNRVFGDEIRGQYLISRPGSLLRSQNYTFTAFLEDRGGNIATNTHTVGSPNVDPFFYHIYIDSLANVYHYFDAPTPSTDSIPPQLSKFLVHNTTLDVGLVNRKVLITFTVTDQDSGVLLANLPVYQGLATNAS